VLRIAANSMAMMVRDRVTEVAVMRALGFGRIHVVTLLLGLSRSLRRYQQRTRRPALDYPAARRARTGLWNR